MSQAKTQMVKSSFGGHLSPIVHGGSSSSSSSTPSHVDEDALAALNYGHFGLQQNLNMYQNHGNWPVHKNSSHETNSSSTSSSSSSNWSATAGPAEPSMMLDELLKNSAQSSLNDQQQRNSDSNWSPFSAIQQAAAESSGQWSAANAWQQQSEAEFVADWSAGKKAQQVPPQAQSKSWAKIVSQQSSPSTNGSNQTTNQKNELSHEWDIKVNQTVPWNLDQANQAQAQTVVPSSSTSSAASSSSSSTSSISSNDKLINKLIQFNKQDTGTDIWQGNPNTTLWEQKETPEPNWSPNQQAPQWNTGWNESWPADQSLVQQNQQQQQKQQQMLSKIEPTGWEDPDFKQNKKSDDGTSIWGDPEQAKMIKIQKWSYGTKHVPNPATIKPEGEFQSNQWKGQSHQQPSSSSSTSSWNNTPAAPLLNEFSNEIKVNSEWNSDLVDTKSWLKEAKNEHEWDHGRVDTSSWGINLPSTKNNFDPSIGVVDTSKWSSGNQAANSTSQMIASKSSSQSNTPGLLNMPSGAGPASQDWNPNIFRDEETRKLSRMNSHPSSSNLLSQIRSNKMPTNAFVGQTATPASNAVPSNNLSQSQLIEYYQLAVQSNLINPDLLNNKLTPDVLALLNKLFQTLNLYTNCMNRINNLNKSCAHLNPQQYKSELDLLKQESQTHQENLLLYKNNINVVHLRLKQQQQQQQQQQFAGGSNLMGNLSGGDVAGISSLNDLPSMLKENQSQSKLMQLMHEQKMAQFATQKTINRQNQVNKMFNSNSTNQWTGFNSFISEPQAQIDDRITPFVPGKPWAGHSQSSIEDDPNCTPGSFSKPLLSESIDPDSILSNLNRGNSWSNSTVDFLGANQNSLLGLNNNNRFGTQQQRNTWNPQQNNFNSLNNSMPSTSGTIGEQIWGVRNNSSRNGMNANSPSNMNRNPAQFNPLMSQQQQQQFFRSNSWNVGPQSNTTFNNPSQLNINSGHYLLIRNVTPQIDQSTLKALCAQHAIGQLTYFKYIPNRSAVIVRYNTKEETNIAHAKLNSISLGNTTINTQFLSENDLKYELL